MGEAAKEAVASFDPVPMLAQELGLGARQVESVVALLGAGNTVPFIARYRKEATGNLDEVQIRTIEERRAYLQELDSRRHAVLASIGEQGKLTDKLRLQIDACTTKAALEDLYLPFKPKRRTRATIARERGLLPLAERILAQPHEGRPEADATAFIDAEKGVADVSAALAGARDIVAEIVAERADVRSTARATLLEHAMLVSAVIEEKRAERSKYEQYYDFRETVATIPSHRFLALRRGEREGFLALRLELDETRLRPRIDATMGVDGSSPYARELVSAIDDAYARLLLPSVETDVRVELKLRSDGDAVEHFARNLRHLLLAPPLGARAVIGVDPGLRTGCKCVALEETGRYLESVTVFPHQGEATAVRAAAQFADFVVRHRPVAIAVGNGTAGRETETFVRRALKEANIDGIVVVLVNESGASIYSASEVAREEFPELDLTIRGAISIARRLQDPLAELVKIDPKSIGVGQYQHDVHQPLLVRKLGEVVESCVNHVGVELNTASAPLLAQVAGVGPSLARRIVKHREEHGGFHGRRGLLDVSGLGPRTFEQSAGFLRVRGGEHPLDASGVHPERYELVERMAKDLGTQLTELVGSDALVERIDLQRYVTADVGEPTLRDIAAELKKPGRDPRERFEPPRFREDVTTLEDLRAGMVLDGVVTNVTAFGAFVDVGVHQDGLVHVSALSERFVKDPHEVVKPGDRLAVRVLDVDLARRRISLSARMSDAPTRGAATSTHDDRAAGKGGQRPSGKGSHAPTGAGKRADPSFHNNPFAKLLR
ncbi:MAG: Tex family protein [Myxococcota bacterium]